MNQTARPQEGWSRVAAASGREFPATGTTGGGNPRRSATESRLPQASRTPAGIHRKRGRPGLTGNRHAALLQGNPIVAIVAMGGVMKRLRSIVLAAVAFGGTALAADPPAAPDSKADPDAEVAALVDSFKHLPLLRSLKIDAKRFSAFLAQSHYARPARDFSTALASVASPLDEACRPVYVEPGGFLKISSAELSGVALRGDPGEIAAALDVAQVQMCLRARKAGLGDEALGGVDAYRSVLARQMVLQEYKRYSAKD